MPRTCITCAHPDPHAPSPTGSGADRRSDAEVPAEVLTAAVRTAERVDLRPPHPVLLGDDPSAVTHRLYHPQEGRQVEGAPAGFYEDVLLGCLDVCATLRQQPTQPGEINVFQVDVTQPAVVSFHD